MISYLGILVGLEAFSYWAVRTLRKDFQWLITPKDELPDFDKEGLKKFIEHGYDPELGWVRKPNTEKEEIGKLGKTKYHIDKNGARKNQGHESLPKIISCYGDSFTFARQVNDNETWEWCLSELTRSDVANFGVGNYGLDQSLLRLKREYPKNKTDVVIMGIVPSTIVRVLDVWKHYNEFGNIFGFKPRFKLEDGKLKLIKNIIDREDKFLEYQKYLPQIQEHDYFYRTKFKKEMLRFPYSYHILKNPSRNIPLLSLIAWYKWFGKDDQKVYPAPMKIIMDVNLKLRVRLFKEEHATSLLEKLVEEFKDYGREQGFTPVFLLMPQKDDILFIKHQKKLYYGAFIKRISDKITVIDLTDHLIDRKDLDDLYSDDNKYGGHYNLLGNKVVADFVYNSLKQNGILR